MAVAAFNCSDIRSNVRRVDKLRALRTFVAIAEGGSLTAAAHALGSSLPAVVRLLAALEAELGTRLFQRTTRRVALTDAGRRYLARCREVLGVLDEAEAELRAEQAEPRGPLAVTAPVLFGQRHVTNGVSAFVERHPKVTVDVQLFDRVVNFVEEGIDVAVRIGELEDSSLVAQHVGTMRHLTVAAPAYLARYGRPKHPKDLLEHNCIRLAHGGATEWRFYVDGRRLTVPVKGNLSINQIAPAAAACAAGLGVGTFFAYQVAPELARGTLVVLLARFEPPPQPIHVVYPRARLLPARSRAFIEFIKGHILAERQVWEAWEQKRSRAR